MHYMDAGPAFAKVNAAVTAGQLLMFDGTTKKVKPATAAAATVIGVARDAAAPDGSGTAMNFGVLHDEVAVLQAPMITRLLVSGAVDVLAGQKVIAGANGSVVPVGAAAALDGTTVVAYCMEPAGVVAGSWGLFKLV